MVDINLSKSVRSNLTALQSTSQLMAKTSDRLSTGNKVNSALDNPTNFFTAQSLNSRAGDLNNLMDSMANGIKTIEAADNGLTSITKNLESMQSTLRQARQDKSFQTASFTLEAGLDDTKNISFSGGSIGATAIDIKLGTAATTGTPAVGGTATTHTAAANYAAPATGVTQSFTVNGTAVSLTDAETSVALAVTKVNGDLGASNTVEAYDNGGKLALRNKDVGTAAITVAGTDATAVFGSAAVVAGTAPTTPAVPGTPAASKTTDQLVNEINNNTDLKGKIRASNDNGKLRIENLSTQELDVGGVSSDGKVDGTSTGANHITGNSIRKDLAGQFNELRDQLDKLSDDASFNGINLLRGDKLKITFNETGTSSIDVQTKKGDVRGDAVNSANLGLKTTLEAKDMDSDASIDGFLDQVKTALNSVRSQASAFGSNLSIVQNRQDFTKSMINTLETGAGNLTLAGMNQEAANMMALQTRQSLASSTLSMANQADQNVLQLLR